MKKRKGIVIGWIMLLMLCMIQPVFAENVKGVQYKEVFIESGGTNSSWESPKCIVEEASGKFRILNKEPSGAYKAYVYSTEGVYTGIQMALNSKYEFIDMIAEHSNDTIYYIDEKTGTIQRVSANFNAAPYVFDMMLSKFYADADFTAAKAAAIDSSDNLYVSSANHTDIMIFDDSTNFVKKFDVGFYVDGLYIDGNDNIYMSGRSGTEGEYLMKKYDSELQLVWDDGVYMKPFTLSPDNSMIIGISGSEGRIYNAGDGSFLRTWVQSGDGVSDLSKVTDLIFAPSGDLLVLDDGENKVQRYALGNQHSVIYSGNGNDSGSLPETQGVVENLTTTLADAGTLSKAGYDFTGWNTKSDGTGQDYAFGETFTMSTADITLYAKWEAKTNTLIYNANGGVGSMTQGSHKTDESMTLSTNTYTKAGYTFAGWTLTQNGSGTVYSDGASYTMPSSSSTTLYAKWTANTNTLTYEPNGGSGAMRQESYKTDDNFIFTTNTYTKAGYTFKGWNTQADGNGTDYADRANFTMPTSDMTVYAQWDTIIDTNLRNLSVSGGYTLSEVFKDSVQTYTVSNVVESTITITASVDTDQYNSVTVEGQSVNADGTRQVSLENGANTFHILVTAQDGTSTKTYTLTVNKLSDKANLKTFRVEGFEIEPDFNKNITSYDLHVTSGSALTLVIEPEDTDSTIDLSSYTTSGSAVTLPVDVGINTFKFKVTAEDGLHNKTYSLVVDRDNNDPRPQSIEVLGGKLSTAFDKDVTSYTVEPLSAETLTLDVTMAEYSQIKINGTSVDSEERLQVPLSLGNNTIEVVITAEDGVHTKTYTVAAYRQSVVSELDGLEVKGYALVPVYDAQTKTYHATVYTDSVVQLIAKKEKTAGLTLNGQSVLSGQENSVTLMPGDNIYTIVSTSEDGSATSTYTVIIYKAQEIARLSNLKVYGTAMNPEFDASIGEYVLSSVTSSEIKVVPMLEVSDKSAVSINGRTVNSGAVTSVSLVQGENTIDVIVTAEDGVTTQAYTLKIHRYRKHSGHSSTSGSSETTNTSGTIEKAASESQTTNVIVNGKHESAGRIAIRDVDGHKVAVVTLDKDAIEERIRNATLSLNGNSIVVPVTAPGTETVDTLLTGDVVKSLEKSQFELTVRSDDVQYTLPAREVHISDVAQSMGIVEDDLESIVVDVKIEKLNGAVQTQIMQNALTQNYSVVYPPVDFTVQAKVELKDGEEKIVDIHNFDNYVNRRVQIPDGIDPNQVTTGVLYNADGTFSHIPTRVVEVDGIYYAELQSMTNSCYSVIHNPVKVDGVKGHWSENAVNDLASRLVIENTDAFDPDAAITRGDYIEYIIKGLGLYKSGVAHDRVFSDMSMEYADSLTIAKAYGIVSGYLDGTVHPDEEITREEAMVILENAIRALSLLEEQEGREALFIDEASVSTWAKDAVEHIVSLRIMNGVTVGVIDPQGTFTYGQAAATIENLLKETELINQ